MANRITKGQSISENIASLLNSAPAGFDEEDEEIDQTSAKVLGDDNHSDEFSEGITERSKIRAQNVDLLENTDSKYSGKVSSRKRLRESSDESDADSIEDVQQEIDYQQSDESENSSQDEEGDVEEEEGDEDVDSESENDESFKHFSNKHMNEPVSKGVCVRNQLSIWENLLETRIQLQKCLTASNKLPSGDNFKKLCENSGEEYKIKLSDAKESINTVLDKMLSLQTILIQKYPETKKLLSEKQKDKLETENSEEEITSEDENANESEEEASKSIPNKRRKNHDYEEVISKRYKLYSDYRNKTIQKWNEKSRIGTLSKNNSTSHTILNQIEHILSDKSKLIKKTQMKKSDYQILGEPENNDNEINHENIYDDDDFYHQLLRELIEFKSSDVTDPIQLGRQWIQLQNMRSKMKRKIDTRATKGRKIRYAVHSKLVNFMAPIDYRNTWTDEAKKELFSSLFGKKQM